jgi:hypothetical protein
MDDSKKEPSAYSAGGRRQKAEDLDAFVKESLEKRYTEQTAKMNKLRTLRLARDAAAKLTAVPAAPRRRAVSAVPRRRAKSA